MTKARDYHLTLEPAAVAAPRLRDYALTLTGDPYAPPAKPRLRDYGLHMSGKVAVVVDHIPDRTVEPGSRVTIEAGVVGGEAADKWVFRRIAGPSVGIEGDGGTRSFTAPSAMPPDGTAVVIGVTATIDGVTSPEQTATITCLPQLRWVWTGTGWVGAALSPVVQS